MKLNDIRSRVGYVPNTQQTTKAATRLWLKTFANTHPLALTLTLKQSVRVQTPCGTYYRRLTRADVERTTHRFQQKLNRAVFGRRAAEKYGKTLSYLPVLEGECSGKNLHLHFAIGNLPPRFKFNQFDSLVRQAKQHVADIDLQHKVDIADSGWLEYITKETGSEHTDNVLWTLVK